MARMRRACLASAVRAASARNCEILKSWCVISIADMLPAPRITDMLHRVTVAAVWESPQESGSQAVGMTLPDGGTLDVAIPPGLVDGQILRLRGKGAPGTGGPGDALIEVEVLPDRRFTREGDDISLELPVSLSEAVLGGRIRVPTPTGDRTMTVPKESNTGTILRLKGKGAPRRGGGHGEQFVKLKVVLPKPPDPELEAFFSNWHKGKALNPR